VALADSKGKTGDKVLVVWVVVSKVDDDTLLRVKGQVVAGSPSGDGK
jgi:hypothetical protein